ncbi:MAG: sulfatase-like hydrolase/transferase, partial [Chitinophagales bacterium]
MASYTSIASATQEVISNNIRASNVMAYMAAVQFMDAQVGRLLDSLKQFPALYANTIVIFISDHGFSLGEKKHWGKWGLWETDIRVPMIIYFPQIPGGVQIQKAVSYLDIFPTICALTETPLPRYPDGKIYTDGIDITPLLFRPDLQYELPAVTTYKRTGGNGSCFPHYSIRNERFHYIRYQNNNAEEMNNTCDSLSASFQEEFYDIGLYRETDPNEWNNLSTNAQYRPMIQFLSQWIPDSSFYLQPTLKIIPEIVNTSCYYSIADSIFLSAEIYDANGELLTETNALYEPVWFATWMEDTLYGLETSLTLQHIDLDFLFSNTELIFYAGIKDLESRQIVALTPISIFTDIAGAPSITFETLPQIDNGIFIYNVQTTGAIEQIQWDYGDGFTYIGTEPPLHNYALPGVYTITVTILFGNNCSKTITTQFTTQEFASTQNNLLLWPNPASHLLNVTVFTDTGGILRFFDLTGREILSYVFNRSAPGNYVYDISGLAPGIYFIHLEDNKNNSI